jgi:hypothetical protein
MGVFLIAILLMLIPLMVMCCCARKPVRHAIPEFEVQAAFQKRHIHARSASSLHAVGAR